MWLREVCSFNYGILLGCIVFFNNYFWWQIHANRAILENLGSSSSPSYFTCLSSVALVFDPWFCQSVCLPAKLRLTVKAVKPSINKSNISYKSCTLLWYTIKEKYSHEIFMFTFTKKVFFPGLPNLSTQIRCAKNQYTTV